MNTDYISQIIVLYGLLRFSEIDKWYLLFHWLDVEQNKTI